MKKLELQLGGVPRKNDTFVHLQSGVQEAVAAICTAFLTHNAPAVAVVLHGCQFSALTGIADMKAGSLFVNGEICAIPQMLGLDMSLPVFFEKSTSYLPPLLYADGVLKNTYAETIYNAYTAGSKNDLADLQLDIEAIRFDKAMANVVGFDNTEYLPSAQDTWHTVTLDPNFQSMIPTGLQYRKTQTDVVYIRGVVQALGNTSNILVNLPNGYKPSYFYRIFIHCSHISDNSISIPTVVDISPTGIVRVSINNFGDLTNHIFYLNISFII